MAKKRNKSPGEPKRPEREVGPGQFSHDYRLQTISLREILLPLKRAVLDIETYRDREGVEHVLTAGTLINALVLNFVELTPARQREVALAAVSRLDAFREGLADPERGEADCNGVGHGNDVAEVAPRPPGAKGTGRRKSG